jgi:hypothetical protein
MGTNSPTGFDAVFGASRGPSRARPTPEAKRQRYGFLRLRAYDTRTHVLVTPQRVRQEFPENTNLAYACAQTRTNAGLRAQAWLQEPRAWVWECTCGGDALSGLVLCAQHEQDSIDGRDLSPNCVIAEGIYLAVARRHLPRRVHAGRSYAVAASLL